MAKRAKRFAATSAAPSQGRLSLAYPVATAFITGIAGILVEVVGARALAPFFGSSLMVWTAQITETLLFLALGYELGGRVSRNPSKLHLPILLFVAAAWLALYPGLRSPVLGMASAAMGIASGSFLSGAILFGIPLLCIGAVSPLLVGYIDRARPGAGSAAGFLFFVSTLGGLAGGWTAVFVVIPYLSVRLCIVGTGVILALIGAVWSPTRRGAALAVLCFASFEGGLGWVFPPASSIARNPSGIPARVLYSRQSDVGLIRVIDVPAFHPVKRALLIDGTLQGGIFLDTRKPYLDYINDLERLGRVYRPRAKQALLLGLGAGLLAKQLHARGLQVTAAELDPHIPDVARSFFDLPSGIDVRITDARSFLRTDKALYDLIYLDAFAGENFPWYLTTVEMFRDARARLRPDGLLLINTITNSTATSPGIVRVVASLRPVFPHVSVFLGPGNYNAPNALVVAGGADLRVPNKGPSEVSEPPLLPIQSATLEESGRGAARVRPGTDDRSDIDYADVAVRERTRRLAMTEFGPDVLGD